MPTLQWNQRCCRRSASALRRQRDWRGIPNIEADALYIKGLVEIQDEGSQLAALIAAAALDKPGQVLDLCAGGGGKTLALAAAFDNHGQIHAYDADKQRLAPIHDRLQRAGVRNVKVLQPGRADLDALAGRMDLVLVDAPCTGTGVWRRRPDAKWRLSSEQLDKRLAEQRQILDQAVGFLRPGGRLVYVTCSLLPAENAEQVAALLERSALLKPLDIAPLWTRATAGAPPPDRLARQPADAVASYQRYRWVFRRHAGRRLMAGRADWRVGGGDRR